MFLEKLLQFFQGTLSITLVSAGKIIPVMFLSEIYYSVCYFIITLMSYKHSPLTFFMDVYERYV